MTTWRQQLEGFFSKLSDQIMQRPKTSLLVFVMLLAAFSTALRSVEFDPEMESFVDEQADVRVIYNEVKEQFGRNDVIMLALQGEVLTPEFLTKLISLHEYIEYELPYVSDVTSLVNAPFQQGSVDELQVLDLIDELPKNDTDVAEIERRITQNKLANEILVNEDRSMALIIIELQTYDYGQDQSEIDGEQDPFATDDFDFSATNFDSENPDPELNTELPEVSRDQVISLISMIRTELENYQDLKPVLAGMPLIDQALQNTMQSEMSFFLRLTVLLIALTLVVFFRQLNAVAAPMFAVLAALLLTISILVLTGNKIQLPLILLPSFLLAITIGDAVHLLTHFYRKIRIGDDKKSAMIHAVERTAVPMLLTSLTTAGGLLSLGIADVVPIRNLGVFAAVGVMLAFVLTICVIPAVVMILPMRKVTQKSERHSASHVMEIIANFSWRHGGKLAIAWLVVVLISLTQIANLKFSHDPMNWMPQGSEITQNTLIIDDNMSGTMTFDVVIDTGKSNGIKNLELLKKLAIWQDKLNGFKDGEVEIKGTSSIIDVVRESNRALQGGENSQYRLPNSEQLLIEELFLFENSASDELFKIVDGDFSQTKMRLVLPWNDLIHYSHLVDELQQQGAEIFGDSAKVKVTGLVAIMAGALSALITSTAFSYLIATIVIGIMMMLLLSSFGLGALAMIPNMAPIIVVMGFMHPMGIPLDMLTMLVATIAIGIAVDNTVHFTHHFRYGLEQGHTSYNAMLDAFAGAGQALLTTCIVLTVGFYVFLFSEVSSVFNLGFLCGTAFILALISNFTLTPFLLRWYYRNHQSQTTAHTGA
ncbi:efflux RND transporter permease subunit [Vibrio sp. WJH972]